MREQLQALLDSLDAVELDDMVTAPQVLDRTAARDGAQCPRRRTHPHRAQGREHPGARARRPEVDAVVAARSSAAVGKGGGTDRRKRPSAGAPAGCGVRARRGGMVTAEQVAVVAPVAAVEVQAEAVGQGVDLAEVDQALAEVASTQVHAALGKVVQHFLDRLETDGPEPDPTEGRSVSIARHSDGSISFRGELDAVGGEKVCAVLESMVQASRPKGDLRSRAQQLGDAFVQWADNALAAGHLPILRTVKPHVIATIPLADLVDVALAPARPRPGSAPRSPPPDPDAGLRRQRDPDRDRPRRAAAGGGPDQTGRSRRTSASARRGPRPPLRVRRL